MVGAGVRERGVLGKKRNHAPIGTLVGADTQVLGDIEFTGGCHVDGYEKPGGSTVTHVWDPSGVLLIFIS